MHSARNFKKKLT